MGKNHSAITFHVALHEPEIPANTGNIGRLCLGVSAQLHLIKPLRFLLTDKYLKRAGLDYWNKVNLVVHEDLDAFFSYFQDHDIYLCTTKSTNHYNNRIFQAGDVFLFGSESRGLPEKLLRERYLDTITIPMQEEIRSLNLANSVAVILYEAWRQIGWRV